MPQGMPGDWPGGGLRSLSAAGVAGESEELVRRLLDAVLLRYMLDVGMLSEELELLWPGPRLAGPHDLGWLRIEGRRSWPEGREDALELLEVWDEMRELAQFLGYIRDCPDDTLFLEACCRTWRNKGMLERLQTADAALPSAERMKQMRRQFIENEVRYFLHRNPAAGWRQIWREVPNPYRNEETMKASLRIGPLDVAARGPPG